MLSKPAMCDDEFPMRIWKRVLLVVALLFVLLVGVSYRYRTREITVTYDSGKPGPVTSLAIDVVMADGTTAHGAIRCGNPVTGSGFLAAPQNSGSACITGLISAPVVDFLQLDPAELRKHCDAIRHAVGAQRGLTPPPAGRATFTRMVAGKRTTRVIDATVGDKCQNALWKIMQPLVTPADQEIVVSYRPGER
jgi:hypothetical protein